MKMEETEVMETSMEYQEPPELDETKEDSPLGPAEGSSPASALILTLWSPEQ